jgi:hypothetical protein
VKLAPIASLEIPQALVNRTEQLNGKHRRLLDGEKKFFLVHHQELAIGDGGGVAKAPMLWCHQSSRAKDVTSLKMFVTASITVPAEINSARQQTEHAVAGVSGTKDRASGRYMDDFARSGEGTHGVKSVQGRIETIKD